MRFQRRGGRKRIVAPDGSEIPPATRSPQPDRTLVKALARARRWQRLLERACTTLGEMADAERISRSYVCRILRLTLLAPDIVERILDGRPTAGLAPVPEAVSRRVGEAAASGSFEEAHDDPRRGYDGMRPRRLPAIARACANPSGVDLPGQAELGRSIHLCGRSPRTHELPLVRLRPTRCPRLDVLDVWQPAATADPFDLDPHTRLQDSSCP